MGWIGPTKAVHHYLAVVHADTSEDGQYIISGAQVAVGLGGDELVVPDETVYFVHGVPKNLAAGLGATSQGVGGIKVFNPGPTGALRPQGRPGPNPWDVRRSKKGSAKGRPTSATNPVSTAQEMVDKIKEWLVANDLSSGDITFATPGEWNKAHGDWQSEIDSGFMVVAEGTRFNRDLAGENGRAGTRTYHAFAALLDRNGWWLQPFTSWAFHIVPDDAKLRLSNPASTDTLERYSAEDLEAMPSLSSGHYDELKVEEGKFRWWVSRLTKADGQTYSISVEERLPQGWKVVHQYGRLDGGDEELLENPAAHVHKQNFQGYAQSAVRHMQLAREATRARDKDRAWNMIRHAECDVRQAYTEATYAAGGKDDKALTRMSGQLVKVHREIVSVMQELRRAQNPATGQHIGELAQYLDSARNELLGAQDLHERGRLEDAAKLASQAETHAIFTVLQAEYLTEHAGETVAWEGGSEIKIPDKKRIAAIKAEAVHIGSEAQQLYMNSVCHTPQAWVAALGDPRMLH